MDVPFAKNFNDYVALMSANSPHALVMDWWRRLDLTLHEYAAALGQVVRFDDEAWKNHVYPHRSGVRKPRR